MYVELDGIKFYKDSKGYYSGAFKYKRLHVYIWEREHGKVPKGYHVHHKDENKENNELSNLELIEKSRHLSLHSSTKENVERIKKVLEEKARPAAIKWHKSKAGREWHLKHYEDMKDKFHATKEIICLVCEKKVEVPLGGGGKEGHKFCSNNCKSTHRRRSGVDNIKANCILCGKEFEKNKYSKVVYCSRSCSAKVNRKIQLEKMDSNRTS